MNDSRLDAGLRPGNSTFPMKHQILTIRLSLQSVFRFCRQIYTQPRLFANHGEDHVNGGLPNDGKPLMQTNVKHGLAAVAANIESLLLQHASALRETVARIVSEIVRCRQRLRPGRSYERRSRKPIGKWQRSRGAPAPATR